MLLLHLSPSVHACMNKATCILDFKTESIIECVTAIHFAFSFEIIDMYIIFSSSSKAKFKTKNSRDCKVQTYLVKKVKNRYVKMNIDEKTTAA